MAIRLYILFALNCLTQSKVIDLTCDQIRAFVVGHNYRRLQLAKGEISGQPAAADMNFMVWDEELAAKAAKWASRNKFEHNPDKSIGSGRFKTGENIYWSYSTDKNFELDPESALKSWFNEHNDYNFGPLKNSDFSGNSKAVGHYTQMAWSNSVYVGCGISEVFKNNFKNYYVVCNYGPSGNYLGETPYEKADRGNENLICSIDDCNKPFGSYCQRR